MKLRSPVVLFAVGVVATIVLAEVNVMALLSTGDDKVVSNNAPLIALQPERSDATIADTTSHEEAATITGAR